MGLLESQAQLRAAPEDVVATHCEFPIEEVFDFGFVQAMSEVDSQVRSPPGRTQN